MIMLQNLFRTRPRERLGEPLYELAVRQARDPGFYTRMGVADRIDARFELYTLHVLLLVMRLRDEGGQGAEAAQALFDTYVSALDHALRELGVGDISVGKKMRKLGEACMAVCRPMSRPCAGAMRPRWPRAWPATCSRAMIRRPA
jgi:cytochrome b pre-mRNA-processing protein 3